MNDPVFMKRVKADWPQVLRSVLERARQVGPSALLAFDLDSTLFDNRPRQARILREFGVARNLALLTRCGPDNWVSGWDMKAAMASCGLPAADIDRVYDDARAFWEERFFTSEYCSDDVAIDGAVDFVNALAASGAIVAYVTGRHEAMRAGTVVAMTRCGLVTPGGNVHLIMKPTLRESDDQFKREAHARLSSLGTLIAAFDNEPTHVNDYLRKFPQALAIHLATDHSGRPVELLEGVVSVPHFQHG